MQVQLKVANGSKAGQLIAINRPRFLIGRAEDCHLKPKSELISRYHCAILSEDGYVAARDLGSKNGVFLNGHRISIEEELKNGDHLVIGPLEFEIVLSVALSAQKKPKVESIEEVVARTVERDTMVPAKAGGKNASEEGNLADWLLEDDEGEVDASAGTKTIQTGQLADLGLSPEVQQAADKLLNMTPEAKSGDTTKTVAVAVASPTPVATPAAKKPAAKAPAKEKAEPAETPDPDSAANLLKNFFQGH